MGGNAQEGTGEEKVGDCGEISTTAFWGRDPTVISRMGNNGPHPERQGGYQDIGIVEVA